MSNNQEKSLWKKINTEQNVRYALILIIGLFGGWITSNLYSAILIYPYISTIPNGNGNGIVLDSFGYDPSGVSSVKMYNISIHHVEHYGLYINGNVFECSFYGLEFRYNEYGVFADANAGNCAQLEAK